MDSAMLLDLPAVDVPKVLEARPYQDRIVTKVIDAWTSLVGKTLEAASVMIESPTGSGKTVMGWRSIKEFIDEHSHILGKSSDDVVVNWCAMRRNLLAQARVENDRFFGVKNVNYVSMFDKNPPKCDILVFDECQHSCADSAIDIYTNSAPQALLGLSATPYRADRQKLCFHKNIRDAGYRQLIMDGYLAKFDQYMLPDWSVESVTHAYLADPKRWGKSLAFFLTTAECNRAVDIINRAGLVADVVTGNSPREEQLAAFEDGRTDILFNVYVLSEGFDCPQLKTVFCRPSSKGPTTQMCGRAFRKFNGKVAQIVQSIDSKVPFAKIATPENQYVLDSEQTSWRNIKVTNAVNERALALRKMVINTTVHLPGCVLKVQKRENVMASYIDNPRRRRRN